MTKPTTWLIRMLVFLVLAATAAGFLGPTLWEIFWNNPGLNGLILLVLLTGIVWNLRQVIGLHQEAAWVDHYRSAPSRLTAAPAPRLLAPMARMLHARDDGTGQRRLTLSAGAMRSLLDGISARLDESRELSRYMTGLLIFLGLLGTFWGLLKTIGAVAEVIASMTVGAGDVSALFEQLKAGLARPLGGMGTAFSASLFGLAGALVLGFLDLTAGQAQNRFFNELEEWLAGVTRLGSGALADGEGSVPAYVQALLEQTGENLEDLRRALVRGDETRAREHQAMLTLNERIGALAEAVRSSQAVMRQVIDSQLIGDDAARAHLRNIELCLQRIAEEGAHGRTEALSDLRNDLRVLTRTVATLGRGSV